MARGVVNQETTHIFAIYAAIAQRVRADPEIAEPVSALLPAYEYRDTRWIEEFPGLLSDDGEAGRSLLVQSLDALGGGMTLRCRLPARRIYALGAAGIAFNSELQGAGLDENNLEAMFRNALNFGGLEGDQNEALFEAIMDKELPEGPRPGTPESIGRWWTGVVATLAAPEAIEEGKDPIGPAPCSTGLVWAAPSRDGGAGEGDGQDDKGDDEPVPTYTTEFDVELSFDEAVALSRPEKWQCFALWCHMEDKGDKPGATNVRLFLETVSLNCGTPTEVPIHQIMLDFVFKNFSYTDADGVQRRVSATEYRLSDLNTDPRVVINEGSIVITELGHNKVRIKTTKRLLFSAPLDGVGFASVMCHVGYLSYVEDLICCATAGDDWQGAWPGWRPAPVRHPKSRWVDPDMVGMTASTISRGAVIVNKWLDDYEKAYKKAAIDSAEKRGSKCYSLGDLLQDTVELWRVALCETGKVANYDIRTAPMATGAPEKPAVRAARSTQ
jgi:hypothetical protein